MELKFCPCCGGHAKIRGCKKYWIACSKCGLTTAVFDTMHEAIRAWNKREDDTVFLTKFEWALVVMSLILGGLLYHLIRVLF